MKKRYKLQELSLDKFKNQVIDALCADRDFWFNDFEDVCDNYGIDSSQFYDKNGNMFDRREVAEYLLDNIDCLYDLADKYGIFNEDFYQDILENLVRTLLKENNNYEDDEELDPFEEYQQDYPNGDFDVSDMTPQQLAKWCQNVGDFLYVYNGLRGWAIMAANTDSIVYDIISDLYNCERIEPTHEVDYLFSSREREFENDYVCIFKVIGTKDGDYYVVYQEDKWGKGNIDLDESRQIINESFKSNELRGWFKLHGGVKKNYSKEGYPNMNVRQDALGDITDKDITYLEEFASQDEAYNRMRSLTRSNNGIRSQYDMRSYFTIYRANDGMCLLVGIDRNNIDTGVTWGGEVSKKGADRYWRDEHSPFPSWKNNRYTDDSGTYYYSRKGQDFGLRTNTNFKGKMSDNNNIRNRMSDKEWKDYQNMRIKDMDDYLRRHYGTK